MSENFAPQNLNDVVIDGIFAQAEFDSEFNASLGSITKVDVTFSNGGFVVYFYPTFGPTFTTTAQQVGILRSADGLMRWTSRRAFQAHTVFGIKEFSGEVAYSPALFTAARTLHGNRPALYAPQRNGETPILVLNAPAPKPNSRRALSHGIPYLLPTMNVRRALRAYAAATELGIHEEGDVLSFSDGTDVYLEGNIIRDFSGDAHLDDIRADAFFFSTEHQMLFDARYPTDPAAALPHFDPATGLLTLHSATGHSLTVPAMVLATYTADTWTWAWADNLPPHLQQQSLKLREYGSHVGIPAFLYPQLPLHIAESWELISAAKPTLQRWSHLRVALNETTTAVLLFDHPELRLPDATTETLFATLQHPVPDGLDAQRAVHSYTRLRGVNTSFDQIEQHAIVHSPETPIHLTFDNAHHLVHAEYPS